jgi:hypothetical protein
MLALVSGGVGMGMDPNGDPKPRSGRQEMNSIEIGEPAELGEDALERVSGGKGFMDAADMPIELHEPELALVSAGFGSALDPNGLAAGSAKNEVDP